MFSVRSNTSSTNLYLQELTFPRIWQWFTCEILMIDKENKMKKEKISFGEITLIGLTVRTNNSNEMNPETSKIAAHTNLYWSQKLVNNIKHRVAPGVTYCVYTDYESDEHGEYTYFIGEEVDSTNDQDLSRFETLIIPKCNYQKFTTEPGKIPNVIIAAWQALWKMNENDFGGKRKYLADFEVYDKRASDPSNAVVDIYIGLN